MNSKPQTVAYEAALAEERLLWQQLKAPVTDVTENVKAFARWSAAAERVKAISDRMHEHPADAKPR